jgi:hypothetical protein
VVEGALSLVTLQGDSVDRMARFISNPDAATVRYPIYSQVIDLGTGASLLPGTWQDWTPTYASSSGNAATTFSGSVTTSLARFALTGKLLTVTVEFSATLNAVTPSWISLTVPTGVPKNSTTYGTGLITDNSTPLMAPVQSNTGGTIRIFKNAAGGNYTSGSAIAGAFTFSFEIA